jgi:Ca-activated chloride channel family protein
VLTVLAIALPAAWAAGGEQSPPQPGDAAPALSLERLDAPEAVRRGNKLLLDDKPEPALEAYGHARKLEPDAREIDFVQGLAHYALGEYDEARAAFENASASSNDSLVDDAIYSIGTTYHAQALQSVDNPEAAIAQLENAMQRYRTVLANQADHEAARDANLKAASVWRTLKEQLQQQQQQQEQNQECDGDSEQDEQQDQSQQQEQEQQEQEQQQQQQAQESQQEQEDQSQQAEAAEQQQDQQEQEEQQAQESQEEQVSREQAERRLREMMQALRDRKKTRQKRVQPVQVVPVDKDW